MPDAPSASAPARCRKSRRVELIAREGTGCPVLAGLGRVVQGETAPERADGLDRELGAIVHRDRAEAEAEGAERRRADGADVRRLCKERHLHALARLEALADDDDGRREQDRDNGLRPRDLLRSGRGAGASSEQRGGDQRDPELLHQPGATGRSTWNQPAIFGVAWIVHLLRYLPYAG